MIFCSRFFLLITAAQVSNTDAFPIPETTLFILRGQNVNFNSKINNICTSVTHWAKRNITLPGKITVIKSLYFKRLKN